MQVHKTRMAVFSMIRRASSPVLRLAVQSVRSPRYFHGAASMVINTCKRTKLSQARSLDQFLRFSSSATKKDIDEELVRVINSGIQCRDVCFQVTFFLLMFLFPLFFFCRNLFSLICTYVLLLLAYRSTRLTGPEYACSITRTCSFGLTISKCKGYGFKFYVLN